MKGNGTVIYPVHPSIRQLLAAGQKLRPSGMSTLKMDAESIECLHRISMSIFADCTNVGVPFQEALAAVYLSGLQHGQALTKEVR